MSEDNKVYEATVIWFSKGMGFLQRDEGQADLFVHWSDITEQEGYKTLRKGQKVSYQLGVNLRDQPKAINVTVLGDPKTSIK